MLPLCHLSLSGLMYCTLGVGEHVGEHRRGTGELSFVAQAAKLRLRFTKKKKPEKVHEGAEQQMHASELLSIEVDTGDGRCVSPDAHAH